LDLKFTIIIPVYNRPLEVDELLDSLSKQTFNEKIEIIIVEDGSELLCEDVIKKYKHKLNIQYYFKENSGPGLSRNYGIKKATGSYYIILDSDCIVPKQYLMAIKNALKIKFTDAFGGPDAAHPSFSRIQKAINYSLTSRLTTGGIRGKKNALSKFQPRSFNMGLSKRAFEVSMGFSKQHFGEDIDLTFRLWKHGLKTQLIEKAFVYHKRRITWKGFFNQTFNFGAARPILNRQHIGTARLTYWLPSIFLLGLMISIFLFFNNIIWPIFFYGIYFIMIFIDASKTNRSIAVGIYSMFSSLIQFLGYGLGFLRSFIRLFLFKNSLKDTFPEMFK
jgi:glycosyltransferase involved in cell wall biosynthesis